MINTNLYIKQKVFSWNDKFSVFDQTGAVRYTVEGEFFSWGKKLHVYDSTGDEAAFIQQKVFSFLPKYFVFTNGREVAQIIKEFTFFRPRLTVEGLGWEVSGDLWAHEYEVVTGDIPIAAIHKQWMTWGDCYELDISNPANELLALAVVLAIDCISANEAAAAAT